jgi:hypothetical protein
LPISFWAKNARTTTIRIGKAALLKNLLMGKVRGKSALAVRRHGRGTIKPSS